MSVWSDFFWTPQYLGGAVTVLLPGAFAFYSARASDRRKFAQEDKLRAEQSLIGAAEDFSRTATEILTTAIDVKGAFNTFRDYMDDPKKMIVIEDKYRHAKEVADAQTRIGVSLNRLKLTAPKAVCDAANKTAVALATVARVTTEPFALPVAHAAATEELNNFTNAVRKEIGKGEYTSERTRKQATSFLTTLQRQIDDYIEVTRDEMRAAGHQTTPWDDYQRKTPRVP